MQTHMYYTWNIRCCILYFIYYICTSFTFTQLSRAVWWWCVWLITSQRVYSYYIVRVEGCSWIARGTPCTTLMLLYISSGQMYIICYMLFCVYLPVTGQRSRVVGGSEMSSNVTGSCQLIFNCNLIPTNWLIGNCDRILCMSI